MARMEYVHTLFSAGISGESFDIAKGHDVTYTSAAGDLVFDDTTKTLTLTAGTWPVWAREVGKVFVTGSVTNPGPFTVVSVNGTFKVLTVLETVVDETPVGTTAVNGSADTRLISNLLSTGNGVLTTHAPMVMVSTGALGAPRTLSLADMETELVSEGGEALRGRVFFLGVDNTDISTNGITVSSSSTINGAATFVISSTGDYLFQHVAGGVWRCNVMPRPAEKIASLVRIPFAAADWSAGVVKNMIKILQTGAPAAGEVGPHSLTPSGSYLVQVLNTDLSPAEQVDVEIQFDNSGNVTLRKAQKAKPFNGVVVISGSLD